MILNKVERLNTSPGGTPGFKWRGWSNGCKNQNPKESHAEFPRLKNFQKAKQVWLYFFTLVAELSRPGYAGTTTNLQIDVNTPENPYLNQAQAIPESKISNP